MTVAQAQALAKKLDFTLDTSQVEADPNVPRGIIDQQDLTPGGDLDRGTTIHATVSMGAGLNPQNVGVPNVVGAQYQDAISTLQRLGLQPAVHFVVQSEQNGYIIAQDPAAQSQVSSGARVNLTLSVNGEVPDTVGETIATATATLASYGYQVANIRYTTSAGADGNVIGTDPDAGSNVQPGSSVTLIVNGTGP
jgi:serine/threonine-protein kinase